MFWFESLNVHNFFAFNMCTDFSKERQLLLKGAAGKTFAHMSVTSPCVQCKGFGWTQVIRTLFKHYFNTCLALFERSL